MLIPLVSERRRRKYEIINERLFNITLKKLEAEASKSQTSGIDYNSLIKNLNEQEKIYTGVQNLLLDPNILKVNILITTISLNKLNLLVLLYDVFLFSASTFYMVRIYFTGYFSCWLIWVFLGLIIINLIILGN